MDQRSLLSDLVLVTIVLLFVVFCAVAIGAVHRGLPAAEALQATQTPLPASTPSPSATRSSILAPLPTPKPTAVATQAPAPTATPSLAQYQTVTGQQLDANADTLSGKKVVVTGSVYYVDPRGENTWVQILTADRKYVDVNFTGQTSVKKGQTIKVYGTADGKTTIVASDGNPYAQPYINPGDVIQPA